MSARSARRVRKSTPLSRNGSVSKSRFPDLKDFHATHPLVPGMDMEELRGKLAYELPPKVFRLVIDGLIGERADRQGRKPLRVSSA